MDNKRNLVLKAVMVRAHELQKQGLGKSDSLKTAWYEAKKQIKEIAISQGYDAVLKQEIEFSTIDKNYGNVNLYKIETTHTYGKLGKNQTLLSPEMDIADAIKITPAKVFVRVVHIGYGVYGLNTSEIAEVSETKTKTKNIRYSVSPLNEIL